MTGYVPNIYLGARFEKLAVGFVSGNRPDSYWEGMATILCHCAPEPWNLELRLEVRDADPQLLISDDMLSDLERARRVQRAPIWIDRPEPALEKGEYILSASAVKSLSSPFDADGNIRSDLGFKPIGYLKPPSRTGQVLHFQASNQHLIYRIGEYRTASNAWEAAWPD